MAETLLQTKLHIPVARSSLVPRPKLLARLNAGLDGRLTLVSAPAGFGKTTLILQWGKQLAESEAWRLAWLSLDENDNDLSRFFTYFITALRKIDRGLGQAATLPHTFPLSHLGHCLCLRNKHFELGLTGPIHPPEGVATIVENPSPRASLIVV